MSCEQCNDEMRSVIRRQNRTLRLVNRNLRRKIEGIEIHSDEVFFTLCNTDPRAEMVLREICERAGIAFSTDDYDDESFVDSVVNALTASSNPTF